MYRFYRFSHAATDDGAVKSGQEGNRSDSMSANWRMNKPCRGSRRSSRKGNGDRTQNVFCTSDWPCVFHQVGLCLFGHKRFSPALQYPSATTPSHSTSIIPIPSPSFVTAIKRLSQPDCSVWRRVRSPFLSSWLLSLKTKKYTYIQKIYICVQTVALQFTEPRWTVRDPNKLLIINWGKYAVIVALAPHLLSFFYGWVAEN